MTSPTAAVVERVADLALGHLTNEQMADKVRMLMRTDLDHEAVCVGARDRILYLHKHLNAMVEAVNRKAAEFLAERERADRAASGHAEMIAALEAILEQVDEGDGSCLGVMRDGKPCFKGSFLARLEDARAALAKGRASEPSR